MQQNKPRMLNTCPTNYAQRQDITRFRSIQSIYELDKGSYPKVTVMHNENCLGSRVTTIIGCCSLDLPFLKGTARAFFRAMMCFISILRLAPCAGKCDICGDK